MIDIQLGLWLNAHRNPLVTELMLLVSRWHGTLGVLLMSAVIGVLLWRAGERWWVLTLLLTVPGGMLLNVAVKNIVQRPRPRVEDALVQLSTFSFPSGHTAGATVFYGFLAAYLLSRVQERRLRIAIVSVAVLMVLLVAFSRTYLGAHYFTDVAGAMVEGLLWLAACVAGVRALRRRRDPAAA